MKSKKTISPSHDEIIRMCVRWLKKPHTPDKKFPKCPHILTETKVVVESGEVPDLIAWNYYSSVLIEAKTSRSDFFRDKKKKFRVNPDIGVGEYRYYAVPEGLIFGEEIPEKWGLLYITAAKKVIVVKYADRQQTNLLYERTFLLSFIRRIKETVEGLIELQASK